MDAVDDGLGGQLGDESVGRVAFAAQEAAGEWSSAAQEPQGRSDADFRCQCNQPGSLYGAGNPGQDRKRDPLAALKELAESKKELPLPFRTAAELLGRCQSKGLSIGEIMLVNERASRTEAEIRAGLLHIYSVMEGCVEVSLKRTGLLPGGLKVRRR
ncbi:hypothetical protein M2428_004505, partial [Arthrobacter sp. ES3-54]|nr:hypothetical protein [Arthrobacter sp. ES3-54]